MINNGQSTLLLHCCEDVKSHRSGGDTVLLINANTLFPVRHFVKNGLKSPSLNKILVHFIDKCLLLLTTKVGD